MPARNSAKTTAATLGQGFECPMGDGGRCELPSPPIIVQRGRMRQVSDEVADLRTRTIASLWITKAIATGVEAMREIVDVSTREQRGQAPAIVLPCSCGHVFTARERS
jgi:hypothetical protein